MTDTASQLAELAFTIDGRRYTATEFAAAKNLTVEGSIYLRGTPITALPEGLRVGGSIYLNGTPITALPEGLRVGGSLYIDPYLVSFGLDDDLLKIGCQHHSIDAWEAFTDNQIIGMDGKAALKFWRAWKAPLLAWARAARVEA